MNAADTKLYFFSIAFAIFMASVLVIPVLRRKSDVFTCWNFFLLGAFVFNGMSGLNAVKQEYLPTLSNGTYSLYFLGAIVFYGVAFATYYGFKAPRKLAGRTLLKWPVVSSATAPLIVGALTLLMIGFFVPIPIPFVSQVVAFFGLAAASIAVTVLTIAWFRDRLNVLLLVLLLVYLPLTIGVSVAAGGSRRFLMCTLSAVPVSMYWAWLRYKPTPYIVSVIGLGTMLATLVLAAYGAVRHSDMGDASGLGRARAVLLALPRAMQSGGSSEGFMGQDSVECALSVIELLNNGSHNMEVDPLASLWLVATNAIPRSLWEDKPESVGLHLVEYFDLKGTTANLGLNVVGQGYYDGGLLVLILYGFIIGAFFRYYDELLIREPGNPFLIGGLVAMGAQIIGWPRGCIGLMGMQIINGFILVVLIQWVGRLLLGTKVFYPRTDHLVEYPVLRSLEDWQHWMSSYTAVKPSAAHRAQPISDD